MWPAGVAAEPPRNTIWPHVNLPLYSAAAPVEAAGTRIRIVRRARPFPGIAVHLGQAIRRRLAGFGCGRAGSRKLPSTGCGVTAAATRFGRQAFPPMPHAPPLRRSSHDHHGLVAFERLRSVQRIDHCCKPHILQCRPARAARPSACPTAVPLPSRPTARSSDWHTTPSSMNARYFAAGD